MPRQVKIVETQTGDSWAVAYIDRKPRQRYWAAVFYKQIKTHAQVVEWVKSNPKLELIP